MDVVGLLSQTIQNLGVILILGGMVIAFLWKAAAIINFVLGFILTLAVTYFVYSITGYLSSTAFIFVIGLVVTGAMAALGAITCMLEGFALSALGFWGALAANSQSNLISSGTIIGAAVASIFSTGIAAFIGGRVFSTKTLGIGKKPKRPQFGSDQPRQITYHTDKIENEKQYKPDPPVPAYFPPASNTEHAEHRKDKPPRTEKETTIRYLQSPSTNSCVICREEWSIDSEIFKCTKCGSNFHGDCIREYLSKAHRCPKCQTKAKMSLN